MEDFKEKARRLLKEFKGEKYIFGVDCLERVGELVSSFGRMCLLITNLGKRSEKDLSRITESLDAEGVEVHGPLLSAKPNAPREDVLHLAEDVRRVAPDSVLVVAGGSGIDAAKAAGVLATLGGDIEDYFGVERVSERISTRGKNLFPLIAVQTASSSAAHLTKYANITDIKEAQKKLIVDEAIVPPRALFDYRLTRTMPPELTLDGAFDGMAHCIEVFYGASPDVYGRIQEVISTGLRMITSSLEKALVDGGDMKSREALGLGTDLGGYAIMLGGTNGPHLNSFSFVDILSHGRAAAIMIPYYTVFFAPAIQKQLQ
ncbi:MAG: iron-containing alcohol dehydrogenase, partial [Candidatus Aminicenantales bacterium]